MRVTKRPKMLFINEFFSPHSLSKFENAFASLPGNRTQTLIKKREKQEQESAASVRNGLEAKHRKRSCEGGGGNRRRRIITTGGQRNRRESCEGVISRPCAVSPVTAEAMYIQTGTLSAAKNGRWCKKSRSLRAVVWGCQGAVDELALVIVSAALAPRQGGIA